MTTLLDARTAYFEADGFREDGGYDKATVTVTVLGVPVCIPNTAGRKRAVVFHDMHHLVTGYATTNLGEAEISAWELGSGCWEVQTAWMLNTAGLLSGVLTSPRRLFRAFVRGRRSANLYGRDADALLRRPVDEVRRELGVDDEPGPAGMVDVGAFAAHLTLSLVVASLPLFVIGGCCFVSSEHGGGQVQSIDPKGSKVERILNPNASHKRRPHAPQRDVAAPFHELQGPKLWVLYRDVFGELPNHLVEPLLNGFEPARRVEPVDELPQERRMGEPFIGEQRVGKRFEALFHGLPLCGLDGRAEHRQVGEQRAVDDRGLQDISAGKVAVQRAHADPGDFGDSRDLGFGPTDLWDDPLGCFKDSLRKEPRAGLLPLMWLADASAHAGL